MLQLLLLAILAGVVEAWGKIGHEMVANVAYERLDGDTQEAVKQILGNFTADGSPLAAVADWADRVRYTKTYHWTTPLHFVDVQDDVINGGCPARQSGENTSCTFDYPRDCKKDMCVAGAIANYSAHIGEWENSMFQGNTISDDSKWRIKEGLMFVTHFVGDIHQPLHCARKSDKGGNTIHVKFDVTDKVLRGSRTSHVWNLHSVWDDGLIDRALVELYNKSRENFEDDLRILIREAEKTGDLKAWLECSDGRNKTCTSQWAEESLEDAMTWAYRNSDGGEVVEGSVLSKDYYETRIAVVRRRIAAAGVRLASTLQLVLSGTGSLGKMAIE
jgi:hypothetical protein